MELINERNWKLQSCCRTALWHLIVMNWGTKYFPSRTTTIFPRCILLCLIFVNIAVGNRERSGIKLIYSPWGLNTLFLERKYLSWKENIFAIMGDISKMASDNGISKLGNNTLIPSPPPHRTTLRQAANIWNLA